ncbi:Regulatory protein BlaR1 [Luteitalea pratensis]|uniref:Regulatory protein BlaR1 n=1 Tax=Luteitalea pratensis TaxID=1855912 RepID=A0A143PUN9_LUTPR|nr:M56 family metallopeptidase [Luteitalea pratensis]AMY11780.1 Regulatory protein BlaR1 [Luteitalea pratensis]
MMLELLVKATLVLGVAALFGAVSRGRAAASTRHAAWVAALVGAVLVPVLGASLPAIRLPLLPAELRALPAPSPVAPVASLVEDDSADASAIAHTMPSRRHVPQHAAASAATADDTRALLRQVRDAVAALPWLAVIWALGAFLVLARLVASRVAAARLTRNRVPGRKPWLGLARRLARLMRVPRRVRFLRSDRVSMPIACGVLRPAVVLPVEADDWQDARVRAVLLHELAHVRRRDCLTQLIVDAAVALLWFHPLAWVGRRAVRRERERACDDLVLVAGTDAPEYATHLLDVARAAQGQPSGLVMSGGVAMARASELEGRLMAILDTTRARHALTARALATVFMVTLAIVAPTSALDFWHAPGATARAVLAPPVGRPAPLPRPAPPPAAIAREARHEAATSAAAQAEPPAAAQASPAVAPVAAPPAQDGPAPMPMPTPTPTPSARPVIAPMAPMPGIPGPKPGVRGGVQGGVPGGVIAPPAKAGPEKPRQPADPTIIAALTEALKDSDLEVRQQALFTLGRYGDPSSLDAMIGALGDADAEMRQQAAFALSRYDSPRARQALAGALKDRAAEVRQQAAFALGALRAKESVDPLLGALADTDPEVRGQAAFALAQIRDPRAADALMVAAKDSNAEVRTQAFFGLAQLGDPRAKDLAIAALKDESPEVRRVAAMALANLVDHDE